MGDGGGRDGAGEAWGMTLPGWTGRASSGPARRCCWGRLPGGDCVGTRCWKEYPYGRNRKMFSLGAHMACPDQAPGGCCRQRPSSYEPPPPLAPVRPSASPHSMPSSLILAPPWKWPHRNKKKNHPTLSSKCKKKRIRSRSPPHERSLPVLGCCSSSMRLAEPLTALGASNVCLIG